MSSTILETQLYPVHCTECGEKIDNRFFPLNRFLKQYFLGVAYSKKISNLVDFLGIGAMYGETVLPDVPSRRSPPTSALQNSAAGITR